MGMVSTKLPGRSTGAGFIRRLEGEGRRQKPCRLVLRRVGKYEECLCGQRAAADGWFERFVYKPALVTALPFAAAAVVTVSDQRACLPLLPLPFAPFPVPCSVRASFHRGFIPFVCCLRVCCPLLHRVCCCLSGAKGLSLAFVFQPVLPPPP